MPVTIDGYGYGRYSRLDNAGVVVPYLITEDPLLAVVEWDNRRIK